MTMIPEMSQYNAQDYQCIMPKALQYCDASFLLKNNTLELSPETNDVIDSINIQGFNNEVNLLYITKVPFREAGAFAPSWLWLPLL